MNTFIKNIIGMNGLSDQVIATDFLISAKSAVRNYSIALTEATSTDLRNSLKKHLNDAIETHEKISDYMMKKGYYNAYNLQEQYDVDIKTTDTSLNLARDNV
jgi:similar to spore coat protein